MLSDKSSEEDEKEEFKSPEKPKIHSHKSQNSGFSSFPPPHYGGHRLRLINRLEYVMKLVRCELVENNFEQAGVEHEKENAAWRNRTRFEEGDSEEEEEEEKEEKEEKKKKEEGIASTTSSSSSSSGNSKIDQATLSEEFSNLQPIQGW
ncbi:uncharacterized protein MONOS_10296 [Monocercomonoides exilis]|uniref:uncharacterized protein n=1 Tax=Monocercomonoides exilis TaxID=2049356 RepID=UPI0035597FD7|nr:hypothetical protein MONOS_10296 [Monocercomonoides exilis]|eukprot:MONOS_10296.1-p1 / transcript=MONOS_10296.1 / gene=MONOS_10296 / organism=Monocercomonoides_exilis_PA203 / gene_product=unspecified product / transcript_product=unspecified product / location=Mono_scaffold00461:47777-48286(-) / protein_length=149 / sequence_SO=supercontig / SO=protein_coding / is_pseudo=false